MSVNMGYQLLNRTLKSVNRGVALAPVNEQDVMRD